MAQETPGNQRIKNPGQFTENSSNAVDDFVLETVIVINSEQNPRVGEENNDLGLRNVELGSNEASAGAQETVVNQRMQSEQGVVERTGDADQGSSGNLNDSVDRVVLETVIIINPQEAASVSGANRELGVRSHELGSSKATEVNPEAKVDEGVKGSRLFDVKPGGAAEGIKENCRGETVCRICHLSSEQLEASESTTSTAVALDLIQLGCGCKNDLGTAHAHCAEAWFKLKGNRFCEICGRTAKNITGVGDARFMEEWNEGRFTGSGSTSSDRGVGCWRGQPLCNFLMACLVICTQPERSLPSWPVIQAPPASLQLCGWEVGGD